jgi:hypothetical protein
LWDFVNFGTLDASNWDDGYPPLTGSQILCEDSGEGSTSSSSNRNYYLSTTELTEILRLQDDSISVNTNNSNNQINDTINTNMSRYYHTNANFSNNNSYNNNMRAGSIGSSDFSSNMISSSNSYGGSSRGGNSNIVSNDKSSNTSNSMSGTSVVTNIVGGSGSMGNTPMGYSRHNNVSMQGQSKPKRQSQRERKASRRQQSSGGLSVDLDVSYWMFLFKLQL